MSGKRKGSGLETRAAPSGRHRTRSRLSLGICPKWRRAAWKEQTVLAQVSNMFFDRCPCEGHQPNQPRLQGNLCRTDWLRLRDCKIRMGGPNRPRNRRLSVLQFHADISAQGSAPQRVGSCRHSEDWYLGIDAQAGSAAPALDTRTVSAIQNQNTGSGTSTWLETITRVSSHLRFRFSFQPRIYQQELISPHCPVSASLVRTRRSPQSPTRAVVLLLNAVWITCSPAVFRLRDQQQQFDVGAS